jgi:hypothetical protein
MVPLGTTPTLVDGIREMVPIVTGTRTLGAPLVMYLSMSDEPPASHNINYVHSWLQDSVAAQPKFVDIFLDFFASDFGGAHSAFRLMITCAARRYRYMLRTSPP